MNHASSIHPGALSLDKRLDRVCGPFEAACKAALRGSPWPRIEDHLATATEPDRPRFVQELILLDVHYRRRAGEPLEAATYQNRFPELDSDWLRKALEPLREGRPASSTPDALPAGPGLADRPPSSPAEQTPERMGEYRILRKVGSGGMGIVYEAVQETLGRRVAVKMLPFHRLLGPTHLERFRQEARAAGGLHHTNIVPVFGVGEAEGIHYYAMQFIPGRSLDRVLGDLKERGGDEAAAALEHNPAFFRQSTSGPLADSDYFRGVAALGMQVADALEYAHRQGIIHRDIKPSNLLVDAAGTVWITDFGLAKVAGDGPVTQPGDLLGTPRYMAPERFQGQFGPRSDIYGLGLTLYELLALRPAFADVEALQLMERIRQETPPPLRSINPRIPRDLETIVGKAIARDPADRYASAEALAEDLRRFLADRPILARRHSLPERAWRWSRRNRALAALAVTVVLLLLGGSGTAIWYVQDRAQRAAALAVRKAHIEREIEVAVQEAAMLGERAWESTETPHIWESTLASALSAIRRAEVLAADAGDLVGAELHERVCNRKAGLEADERDRQLVAALEQIRLEQDQVDVEKNRFTPETAVPKYLQVFRAYGLEAGSAPVSQAAELIRRKRAPLLWAIVAALDDWSMLERTAGAHRDWLKAVIAAADTDEWRSKVRNAAAGKEREALEQLVNEVEVTKQPPAALILLKRALQGLGGEESAIGLLRRAQHQFPGDFWLNHELGNALTAAGQPIEAVPYFRAALALRPRNCGAQYSLALALHNARDLPGAVAGYQRAIDINPQYGAAALGLGVALRQIGDFAAAIAACQRAIDLDFETALAHNNLGTALYEMGNLADAVATYEKAIHLDPTLAIAHTNLGNALRDQGKLAAAVAACQRAVDLDPKSAKAYNNLGIALRQKGDLGAAIAAYQKAVALDSKHVSAHYNLGFALSARGDLNGAIAAYQRAIDLDPEHAQAHCNLGWNLRLQGKFAESLRAYQRGHELGSKQKGWRNPSDQWLRTAERIVELDRKLPAIVNGRKQPENAAERTEYALICGYKGQYAAGARLYEQAFASQPGLADDLRREHRYNAASLAVRAGTGQGEDAGSLKESQRAELRRQALDWLHADLAAWAKLLQTGQPKDRSLVQRKLQHWQRDPDLAALRDETAVAKLPESEQPAWRQLWADVAATLDSRNVRYPRNSGTGVGFSSGRGITTEIENRPKGSRPDLSTSSASQA
jgi:serine/threonine protein kinase/Flp pilus assembly protein TadD